MPVRKHKQATISFKVDETLAEALQQVPNRSEFIRNAILGAMDNSCPLCRGAGVMSQEQRSHWQHFLSSHSLKKCEECNALHLTCPASVETGALHLAGPRRQS